MQAGEYAAQPGDVITVTDGYQTKTMTVPTLEVTGFDLVDETITGISDPLRHLVITAGPLPEERTVQADAGGIWIADFSVALNEGESVYDLQLGESTEPQYYDADWDHTVLRDVYLINPAISGNAGAAGVTLSYDDGGPQSVTADGSGDYEIIVPFNWSGAVTPSLTGHNFSPTSRSYSYLQSDRPGQDYGTELMTYTLTYTAGLNGSISGDALQYVDFGLDGTEVEASPATGYHFTNWSDGILTAARTDTNVTDDITVTANFAVNSYTLTYAAGAGGSISGTSPQTVDHGSDGTLVTAVPNTGYHFTSWSDGILTAARTDTNVTDDITVTANFADQ